MINLPTDKMPEAEVILRLALFLISNQLTTSAIRISIDGAQVQTKDTIHFPVVEFLQSNGWGSTLKMSSFQGIYIHPDCTHKIEIDSTPGHGDLVTTLINGKKLRVESKKGPITKNKSSQEYVLLREALGQLITVSEVCEDDLLAVAIPSSPKFEELAARWRAAPLIKKFDITILTVDRHNHVHGFTTITASDGLLKL